MAHPTEQALGKAESVYDLLSYRACVQGDENAFFYLDKKNDIVSKASFVELFEKCEAFSDNLVAEGLEKKYIAILCDNDINYLFAFLGALITPAIPITVNPVHRDIISFLENIKRTVGELTVVASRKYATKYKNILEAVAKRLLVAEEIIDRGAIGGVDRNRYRGASEDIAFLQFSSGSTTKPKGIIISNKNLLDNSRQIQIKYEHTRDTIGMSWMPNYHDLGLIGGIFQPLYAGFKIYIFSHMSFISRPLKWLEAISRYRVNTTGGPNFAYDLCVERFSSAGDIDPDLSSWDVAFIGADRIYMNTLDRFYAVFKRYGFRKEAYLPAYGLAETVLFATAIGKRELPESQSLAGGRPGEYVSCGKPVDTTVAVVDPLSKVELAHGKVGEIWLKGDSIAKGYLYDHDGSSVFLSELSDSGRQGRYLNTGDLGFKDDAGNLYITGRSKEVMIVNGENIYPQDIEHAARCSDTSAVGSRVAAFQISRDIVLLVEIKRQFLKRQAEITDLPELIKEKIYDICGVVIEEVILVNPNSIPVTTSGKIKRLSCRHLYPNGLSRVFAVSDMKVGEVE